MDKILVWDSKDDYFNAFFEQYDREFEVVIRKNFDKVNSDYSIYIEKCEDGSLLIEEPCKDYDELVQTVIGACPENISLDIPSKDQLSFAKSQWEEHGDHDDLSEYDICTECYDPDCIEDIGGCNL